MKLLGTLWASPATLLALLLAWSGGCRRWRGTEWIAPSRGPWAWFFARGWSGITIGEVVVYGVPEPGERLVLHEARHVQQWRRLGVFFPVVYLALSALAWVMGRDVYFDNWFELDARLWEAEERLRRSAK